MKHKILKNVALGLFIALAFSAITGFAFTGIDTSGKVEAAETETFGTYEDEPSGELYTSNYGYAPTAARGVDYALVYSYEYYVQYNPDVAAAVNYDPTRALIHFVDHGMQELRRANPYFDARSYKKAYPDLRAAYGNDNAKYYLHYMQIGYGEGRNRTTNVTYLVNPVTSYRGADLSSVYDYYYYTSQYPYVLSRYGEDNDTGILEHFVKEGILNGERGRVDASPGDLYALQEISKNLPYATTYYYGIDLSKVYDYVFYAWYSRDVALAYGFNPAGMIEHFVITGMNERRVAKANAKMEDYAILREELYKIPQTVFEMAGVANGYDTSTGSLILVNKAAKMVGIYYGQRNSYTNIAYFPCAIGARTSPTPNGVYQVGHKGIYFNTGLNGRCWYYTQIKGNYLFHSQIYDRQSKPVNLIDARIGDEVSHGCIRLKLYDAKWIYDNIPTGSTIVIY